MKNNLADFRGKAVFNVPTEGISANTGDIDAAAQVVADIMIDVAVATLEAKAIIEPANRASQIANK